MSDEPKDFLTEEDKKFIMDNYKNMSVFQMAIRRNIVTQKRECRLVSDFIKSAKLDVEISSQPSEETTVSVVSKETKIPGDETIKVVEKIMDEPAAEIEVEEGQEKISVEEFAASLRAINISVRNPPSEKERRDMLFVMRQMDSTRFLLTYKTYSKREYKSLFREEFIRSMYGKGEMPQEEVNDFIDICNQMVYQHDIKCKIRELEKLKDKEETPIANKIAIDTLIIQLNDKYDVSLKRTGEIKEQLGVNREQRLKDSRPTGLTVIALIEAFHNEEKREALAKLQDTKDKELSEVLGKFDIMPETKSLIMGISREELLEGGL